MILQSVHALQSALPLIGKDKKAQAQLMPIINKIMNALRNIEDPDLKVKATEIMTTLGGMGKAAGRLKKWDVGAGQAAPAGAPAAPAAPMGAPGAPMAGTPMPGQMVAHRKPEGLVVTEGLINYIQKYNLS